MVGALFFALTLAPQAQARPLLDDYSCSQLGDMPGPEDFDVVRWGGDTELLVGADHRRDGETGDAHGVYRGPVSGPMTRSLVEGRDGCSLRPHGVSTLEHADGSKSLFAVVHFTDEDLSAPGCELVSDEGRPRMHAVERFTILRDRLVFEERLSTPLLTNPNDVDARPDGRIAVSNNPDWQGRELIEDLLLGRATSQVLEHSPEGAWRVAAEPFLYANGVLYDRDGDLLVSTYGGHLFVLEESSGTWLPKQHLRLRGAMDNLLVDELGRTWLTGHPSSFGFLAHSQDPEKPGPSQLWALRKDDGVYRLVRTYEDRSGALDAASTAVWLDGKLVMAQVFDPGLVVCERR